VLLNVRLIVGYLQPHFALFWPHGDLLLGSVDMQTKMSFPREEPAVTKPAIKSIAPKSTTKSTSGIKRRSPPPHQPFDPDDLTRRLLKVQTDQRAYAERKRRARVEAERQVKEGAAGVSFKEQPVGASSKEQLAGASPQAQGKEKEKATRAKGSGSAVAASGESSSSRAIKERPANVKLHMRSRVSHADLARSRGSSEKAHRKASKIDLSSSTAKPAPKPTPKSTTDDGVPYHHVPQVAAAQFVRTTTTDCATDKKLVHKLSKKALDFHLKGPQAATGASASNHELTQLRKAQSYRDRLYERNQFQHTQILEAAAEVDEDRGVKTQHRHTIEGQLGKRSSDRHEHHRHVRRKSTGNLFPTEDSELESVAVDPLDPAAEEDSDPRVDWSQSDEKRNKSRQGISPLLRKADSIWALRGRLGSLTKHGREDKSTASTVNNDTTSPADAPPKSPKAGFFSWFKR
jgi:hypothetical protein